VVKSVRLETRYCRTSQRPNGAVAEERDGLKAKDVRRALTAQRHNGASDHLAYAVHALYFAVSAIWKSVVRPPRRSAAAPFGSRAIRPSRRSLLPLS